MSNSKGREAAAQKSDTKQPLDERLSEATNDETLSELEEKQKIVDSPRHSQTDTPAPDAEPAKPRKERDDAEPM